MDSLPVGSIQFWLTMTATFSPVIALLVGFAGADWLLRWLLGEERRHAPLERPEAGELRRYDLPALGFRRPDPKPPALIRATSTIVRRTGDRTRTAKVRAIVDR